MPLFMDRHDVPGATAEDVASAHVSDLAVAGKYGVEFLSYWFDPDRNAVFCFARSPSRQELVSTHEESHGLIPHEIIGVSEDSVLRFLGTVRDPADWTEVTSPFRIIVFTDLEDSTSLTEELGLDHYMVLLTEHDLIIRREIVSSSGREVKHTGDGFLVAFDGVSSALRFCIDVQRRFSERSASGATPEVRVKIGVTAGEPVDHNDDIFGTPVNLAARLCDAAAGGEIIVAADVAGLDGSDGFVFEAREPLALKGFDEPVEVRGLVVG